MLSAAFIFPDFGYPAAALAWCLLIYGLAHSHYTLSKFFSTRLLYRIGEYSYSTYLAHYFLRDWIKFLVFGRGVDWRIETRLYLTATATASVVLYALIEVPGRDYVRRRVNRNKPVISSGFPIGGGIRPGSDGL